MAATNEAIKWNKRLNEGRWFQRAFWRVTYSLGRFFTAGKWNPLKKLVSLHQIKLKKQATIPQNLIISDPNVINLIAENLTTGIDVRKMALACRFFSESIQPALNKHKLAHYTVVAPNKIKLIAMLNACQDTNDLKKVLNTVINEVEDPSGRILINNTILQLARGADDDLMCLALKPFFIKAYGSEDAGIKEIERQLKEKFDDEDTEESKLKDAEIKAHLGSLLQAVIQAITNEEFNHDKDANGRLILSNATLKAIETFRSEFAKTQPKRIEKGMHFRSNTLVETYDAYVQARTTWNYDYNKCALFEDGVLSDVLARAPANDGQKFSQGLYYLQQDKNEEFIRSLALRVGKNNFYDVVAGRPRNSLFKDLVSI